MKIGERCYINEKFIVEMTTTEVELEEYDKRVDFDSFEQSINYEEDGVSNYEKKEPKKTQAYFILFVGSDMATRYTQAKCTETEWNDLTKLFRILRESEND